MHKMVAQSRGGVIVESLIDGRRFPVSTSSNVSSLKDIAIYTYNEEIPLGEVFQKIGEKEDYQACIDAKSEGQDLRAYMEEVLPDFDQERVYNSDLKKLFSWYNLLQEKGFINAEAFAGDEETESGEEE